MLIPLLLALHSAFFGTQSGGRQSSIPPGWPVEWVANHCPEFHDQFGGPVKVASCSVSESGEFSSFRGDTYYYGFYCVAEKGSDPKLIGSCQNESVAVFVRHGADHSVRLVLSRFPIGRFRPPRIGESSQGAVMELPSVVATSCDCNQSTYYLWRPQTRDWTLMDWESWQREIARKLPEDLRNLNGYWPDLHTLTTDGALWRDDDAHCCPSGGSVSVQLGIVDNRFVLKSFDVKVNGDKPPR